MPERPGLWGRIIARAPGEVPADTLEAYRRAGGRLRLLTQAEATRQGFKDTGQNPWAVDPATQAFLLCSWNAFVLQALGDQFMDADYQLDPATSGYVPPVTAKQVLAFYSQVEGWVSRARQAQSNPAFRLDVHVPADLPHWSDVEPCPRSHLEGMVAALRLVQAHAESAKLSFESDALPKERQPAVQQLRQYLADASTQAQYAEALWSRDVSQELHEQIEQHAKRALEGYYHLGQFLAMPELLNGTMHGSLAPAAAVASPQPLPLPGQQGFDPWCLTDPISRSECKRDRAARRAIAALWDNDPNPRQTLAIQADIDAALARGDIDYAVDSRGEPLGRYYCCPWSAIYVVKRPVRIGGRSLRTL
jgi:hypothetical protein